MESYRVFLFDFDGTVSESAPGIIKSVQYSLRSLGIEETDMDVLKTFIGPPLNVQYRKVYGLTDEQIVTAVTKFRELYETKGILDCRPYPGLDRLFREATEKGKILAVASSKPEPFVEEIVESFGFTDYFTAICGSDIGDELKPKPAGSQKARIIRKALARLAEAGVPEEDLARAVMIGDTQYDVCGARENDIPCVGITYGYGTREELEESGADSITDSPDGLRKLLLSAPAEELCGNRGAIPCPDSVPAL